MKQILAALVTLIIVACSLSTGQNGPSAHDPGLRTGAAGAGGALPGLQSYEQTYFTAGTQLFIEPENLADGLGPRFNMDSCGGCHAYPATGGSSPLVNPQIALATADNMHNVVPSFISASGPIREVRFKENSDKTPDGGVHDLYTIAGRVDPTGNANDCSIQQEDFVTQMSEDNIIFRIPTPTFGLGLIEAIPSSTLVANLAASASQKSALGIKGRFNANGNTGTITKFGWKAQNASLLIFAGEAYNVEIGISDDNFPTERDESPGCLPATTPNSFNVLQAGGSGANVLSSMEMVTVFMRFLAAPAPSPGNPGGVDSTSNGSNVFAKIGCSLCHTSSLQTGNAQVAALRYHTIAPYSDFAIHHMGPELADGIQQGVAQGDEFRTAPLWGLGQRAFFLHDGRATDLVSAIELHSSAADSKYPASEANAVVNQFNALAQADAQDLLNFLRSL